MCEVISCDKRGKADFTSVKHIWHFFFEQEYGLLLLSLLFFFWRAKDEWRQLMDTSEKREIIWTETRSLTQPSLSYQFFLRAWVSVNPVPRRSLLIRCPREVSVTSQRKVESRNDRAENAWGLGWVSVFSWIWTGPPAQQVWQDETRSLTQPSLSYQFFLRAWVSVSPVPRRYLLIRCPREVSVTSQRKVESRNDRAENAWGLGLVSVLSWIWTGPPCE